MKSLKEETTTQLDKDVEQTARNPYKTVFEHKTWGGMTMASISVHEDDFGTEKLEDDEKMGWHNIRVEICVAGQCIGTTLDKIVNSSQELASAKEEGAREERERMGDFIENGLKYRYEKLAKVRMKHFTYNSLLDVIKDELTNPLAKDK